MTSRGDVASPIGEQCAESACPGWLAKLPEQNPDVVLRLASDSRVLYMNPSARAVFGGELALGARAPAALLPAISRALESGAAQKIDLQRGERWLSMWLTPDGQEANVYGRDITARKQVEQALRESERHAIRLNAVLSGIARIFQEALTCATEEELGKVCLSVAEELTQSKFGYIDEINQQSGKLDAIAISDPGWDVCRMPDKSGHGQNVLSGFSIAGLHGEVLREGAALITNAPSSHPGSMGTPDGHPKLKSFLGVPLKHAGRTIGLVGLGNREGGYSHEDLTAVEALAPAIVQAFLSKRAEQRLRHSHEQYRHLVESAGSVILRVDNIYDETGNLVEVLSIGNDLSELKRAEAALRQAVDQLQETETRHGHRHPRAQARAGCAAPSRSKQERVPRRLVARAA